MYWPEHQSASCCQFRYIFISRKYYFSLTSFRFVLSLKLTIPSLATWVNKIIWFRKHWNSLYILWPFLALTSLLAPFSSSPLTFWFPSSSIGCLFYNYCLQNMLTQLTCSFLCRPERTAQAFFQPLKGQVTFLKLCLLVVCLALIFPRFTLFWLKTVFRPKNVFECLCQRSLFLQA